MRKHSVSDLTQQWHHLRSHCHDGKKSVDAILLEYTQLENTLGDTCIASNQEAVQQLHIVVTLWIEDIAAREQPSAFLRQRYRAINNMFNQLYQFLELA